MNGQSDPIGFVVMRIVMIKEVEYCLTLHSLDNT